MWFSCVGSVENETTEVKVLTFSFKVPDDKQISPWFPRLVGHHVTLTTPRFQSFCVTNSNSHSLEHRLWPRSSISWLLQPRSLSLFPGIGSINAAVSYSSALPAFTSWQEERFWNVKNVTVCFPITICIQRYLRCSYAPHKQIGGIMVCEHCASTPRWLWVKSTAYKALSLCFTVHLQ